MLALVNRILDASKEHPAKLFDPNLHPHGIEELVAPPVERMAYATVNLLRNLEVGSGQIEDRLLALQTLYDEVLSSAHSTLRRNTARVLMQIMKDIVRAHGDYQTQLKLAHDFRSVVHGTPRIVRRMLSRYHLPEMPEEWNQIAFDDHVYDVNTRGRKTPTHLIMDAWIKGIRSLTVAYEYSLEPEAIREIMRAAQITGIQVRIGLEFQVPFYGHFIHFFWIPRGFSSDEDFLSFLKEPTMLDLMARGREALDWRKQQLLKLLAIWNERVRPSIEADWRVPIPVLEPDAFIVFCRGGNPTRQRLADCLYAHVLSSLEPQSKARKGEENEPLELSLHALTSDIILDEWLSEERYPEIGATRPDRCIDSAPEIMRMSPKRLTDLLTSVVGGYRLVLGTTDLSLEDVVELLWECHGAVTHLEIFNMKGWVEGKMEHMEAIARLQRDVNLGLGPKLKQLLRKMAARLEACGENERAQKFLSILGNVHILCDHYSKTPLKTRLGTSSVSRLTFGMGLVLRETMPKRAQAELDRMQIVGKAIPVYAPVEEQIIYRVPENPSVWQCFLSLFSWIPGLRHLGMESRQEWKFGSDEFFIGKKSNIVNLGGISLFHGQHKAETIKTDSPIYYMNTTVVNCLKVLLGFIPAFFSFFFIQDWWVLAWLGAFIWFGITGIRNVLQMVMAARGASRGTLVHWTKQVSWPRLCDSLMYTGISVLLLEVLVRDFFLERVLHVTVEAYPLFVYTVLNCVNALYIFCHNIYRGFPRQAAIGNIFRSALSIPMASLYDGLLRLLLLGFGVADPAIYLVPSAAIISKCASDTVAALIEGYADGQVNLRMRRLDFEGKFKKIFACYNQLELLFPKEDALSKIGREKGFESVDMPKLLALERAFVVHALDLMYFWFYQPRAQEALRQTLRSMSKEDRMVLAKAQLVLTREHVVSQMLVDGLLGRNFSRPLAFFLDKHRLYLRLFLHCCRQTRHRSALR